MIFDSYGLFRFKAGDEGNTLLFTAEYMVATDDYDAKAIWDGVMACRIERGLYARHPVHFKTDAQSPDNTIGLGVIAHLLDPQIAADILLYLKRHRGMYRIEPGCPWYREWMYRFPSVIAHLNWCAGRTPPWYQRIAWAVSVAFKLDKTPHDSWVLSWLLIEVAGDKGWLERWATRRFWKRFPYASVADLLEDYFGVENHPIVELLRRKNESRT